MSLRTPPSPPSSSTTASSSSSTESSSATSFSTTTSSTTMKEGPKPIAHRVDRMKDQGGSTGQNRNNPPSTPSPAGRTRPSQMTGFTTLTTFAIELTICGLVAHELTDLAARGHSPIPHPSRIGINEHLGRNLLQQGHGEDTRASQEFRAPGKVLVFRRHNLTKPTELL